MQLQKVTIYTPNLQKAIEFYSHTLKFPLLIKSLQSATFRIGKTRLTFIHKKTATPYHIGINIPSNKETEALAWLQDKVKLLTFEEQEMIDFPQWDSKAMFFHDMDGNVIEFIARKNLYYTESMPFHTSQAMGISEIGMAVDDVKATYEALNNITELPVFDGNPDGDFVAAGDEKGLFIIINKNNRSWYPTEDKAYTSDFILNGKSISFRYIDGEIYPTSSN